MASSATPTKRAKARSGAKSKALARPTRGVSNAKLLKMVAKRRPPQSWYDDAVDPTKPATSTRRER